MKFLATKKYQKNSFPPLLFWCCCWIQDQVSGMDKNQYPGSGRNIPDPQD